MAPRDDDKASRGGSAPPEADVAACMASKRKAEEDFSPAAAADEMVDEVEDFKEDFEEEDFEEDFDEDPFIWNLNRMRRQNMLTPEIIEDMKKRHYESQALFTKLYLDMDNDDYKKDTEADKAEFKEWSNQLRETARANLTTLNIVSSESCGVDAGGVYMGRSCPHDLDAAVVADAPSSQDTN